jgi:pimeloyl-ACP methyl ester carboxylesterase
MPWHENLHYEVIPNILPENTVFIHGNLASSRWWYPAEQVWRRKAQDKNYQGSMILLDLPGCGKSTAPAKMTGFDLRRLAKDLNSLIESSDWGPAHLVGHSAGGCVAALMLENSPHLFRRAVLLDPVGATGVQVTPVIEDTYQQMLGNKELVAAVIGSTIYNNDPDSYFFRWIVVEDAFQAVKNIGMGLVSALSGLDIRGECSRIQHSVLVLHGEHDLLLPVSESHAMSNLMKNSKFQMIPGQGHCANTENPTAFVDLVESFAFCH